MATAATIRSDIEKYLSAFMIGNFFIPALFVKEDDYRLRLFIGGE